MGNKRTEEAYVVDDPVLGEYAPADEYVIFHVESETFGKDNQPLHVAFMNSNPVERRQFFGFIAKACAIVLAITSGVYVVQRHYSPHATLYTVTSGSNFAMATNVAYESAIPSHIRVVGQSIGSLKNLTAGTLQNQIQALNIQGVQVAASTAKALIGNHIVSQGDRLWVGAHELIFKGVTREQMVFEDGNGHSYTRDLKKTPFPITKDS
jgi:hypothetical protein